MKTKIILSTLSLLISVMAQDITEKQQFSSVCVETSSIGFANTQEGYKQRIFTSSTYIISKVISSNWCNTSDERKKIGDIFIATKGCYQWKVLGTKISTGSDDNCLELWDQNNSLYSVSCNSISFKPNGTFSMSNYIPSLDSDTRFKSSSIFVSHGKCSTIR